MHRLLNDRRFFQWAWMSSGAAGLVLVLVVFFLVRESANSLVSIGIEPFFFDDGWYPQSSQFNLTPMLVATLLTSVVAVTIATPLAILCALFSYEVAPPKIGRLIQQTIEVLGGVPSVIYGFWGLVVLIPWINNIHPPGSSLLAATMILTIMILPTIAMIASTSLKGMPREHTMASHALSLGIVQRLRCEILPNCRAGFLTASLMGLARALGETMAVLMVCGNVVQMPKSFFDPVRTLTANMALEMAYALDQHRSALFFTGLTLIALVGCVFLFAELASRRLDHAY